MKLKESIPSNSIKIIELYNKIESGNLDTSPEFQRKLVWKKQHKYAFISTILLNYPFPEIYIASSEMDIAKLKSHEIVVDGKQRITTIVDYVKGVNDFAISKKIKPFAELNTEEKRAFLNYSVTIKDLKDLDSDTIKDVFERINSTDYSLNSNERLNARFGDGEFAMFCKQIVDSSFNPTDDDTDIIIEKIQKNTLNIFFNENNIFSDHDKSRMFDTQFLMLLTSTLLEGGYFGRSSRVNNNLEKYNSIFPDAKNILDKILKAVVLIEKLKFSPNSYWFNKANLFTLLVEFAKIDESKLDIESLERGLLDLEKKVDIYFTDEDISLITEDERKYFEFARQGSNELTARQHRGKVIEGIIANTQKANEIAEDNLAKLNMKYLKEKDITYAAIIPTETSLNKAIMDATNSIREFLKVNGIHDYDKQEFGPDKKVQKEGKFIGEKGIQISTTITFYRANGRGDYRIWFSELNKFANGNDELALLLNNSELNILNLTQVNYSLILS
jgi:hypothetical protein